MNTTKYDSAEPSKNLGIGSIKIARLVFTI